MCTIVNKLALYSSCVTAAVALASPTFASSDQTIGAKAGPYIGVNVGAGGIDVDQIYDNTSKASANSHHEDVQTVLGRIYAGYAWNISSVPGLKLGGEAGFTYYNPAEFKLTKSGTEQKWDYSNHAIDLLGTATYNIAQSDVFVMGKLGAAYTSQEVEMSGFAQQTNHNRAILPKAAVALGYNFTSNLAVKINYSRSFGDSPDRIKYGQTQAEDDVLSMSDLTIGVSYHF